jgi:hypothetical protein
VSSDVVLAHEAVWVPGPVWTGAENFASTRIRSPDRPACGVSLYRLSYPGTIVSCRADHHAFRRAAFDNRGKYFRPCMTYIVSIAQFNKRNTIGLQNIIWQLY